jgi:fatty acid desaturase
MDGLQELKKIELEEDTLKDLDTTRKWSMFIAILGFIAVGLMLLIGLIAGVFLSVFKTQDLNLGAGETILIFGILLVFGVIYFFPILYLYRFSKYAGHAVRTRDNVYMKKAFRCLRKYFVYIGILAIVVLAFYLIAIIASGASLAFLKDLGTGV